MPTDPGGSPARHEVPPADAFGAPGPRRRKPHIYAPEEIARLLAAAARLGTPASLEASTYGTLFGLLAATGRRVSEALALPIDDVTTDGLLIGATEFQKSRPLPPYDAVRAALDRHLEHPHLDHGTGGRLVHRGRPAGRCPTTRWPGPPAGPPAPSA